MRSEAFFGTTLGGLRHLGHALRTDEIDGYRHTTTSTFTRDVLKGTGFQLGGTTITAACASGLSALMLGATALLHDEADMVLAIGYDPISEFAYAGFSSLRLVTESALRPFTEGRDGMRVGEGAAAFVMERRSSALARGARPIATVLGWGATSDAHHLTQPDPTGSGAARSLSAALSGNENQIPDVLFAHATSTPANDAAEYAGMRMAMGSRLHDVPVTALKSRIGHTLGAAGAVETAITIASLEAEVIPSVANACLDKEAFAELDLVTEPRAGKRDRAAVVSLGFGGANAAVLVEKHDAEKPWKPARLNSRSDELALTGIGVLVPEDLPAGLDEWHLDDGQLAPLEDARVVRRLSRLARLVRAAGILASRSAGLNEDDLAATSGFAATRFGAVDYTLGYYEELIRDGLQAGNPLYFAESVPNIGSAQLSLGLGLKEMCLSIGGTRICALEALHVARRHIASGQSNRAIVVAAEETDLRLHAVLSRLGMLGPDGSRSAIAEGAVALVVEDPGEAACRGATVLARVKGTRLEWPTGERVTDGMRSLRKCGIWGDQWSPKRLVAETGAQIGKLERRALRIPSSAVNPAPERHSVGPLHAIANWAISRNGRDDKAVLVTADESGGAAAVHLW